VDKEGVKEMIDLYEYAFRIWIREDLYNDFIKNTTHKELESMLEEICKSGPITVVPYRDAQLSSAYIATDNRLQGVQFALWYKWTSKYSEVTHPEDLAQIVDYIVKITTPEVLESMEKNIKTVDHMFAQVVLPWYKKAKKDH
jgi:hypothetical protein